MLLHLNEPFTTSFSTKQSFELHNVTDTQFGEINTFMKITNYELSQRFNNNGESYAQKFTQSRLGSEQHKYDF